jgi:hypothetical protein
VSEKMVSEKIWTRLVRARAAGHPSAQVVQIRKGAEVIDALMDPTGAVVLTYTAAETESIEDRVLYLLSSGAALSAGEFVRTVRHPGNGELRHVLVAEADEQSLADVAAAH